MNYFRKISPLVLALGIVLAGRHAPSVAAAEAARAPGPLAAQEAELRFALADTAVVVSRDDEALQLRFPVRLAFAPDESRLLPAATAMLDTLARSLRDHERTMVEIAVYTDAIGSSDFNALQAETRAAAVAAYLHGRGLPARRFIIRGAGESQPVSAENTPEGRDLNRRLEFTLRALSS
jgi:outer membrane protein OmpA-like peptidoglycan-associated protein